MRTRYYYRFNEILPIYTGSFPSTDKYYPITENKGIHWLISQLLTDSTIDTESDDAITKQLMKHIWLNLKDKFVCYLDIEHPAWEHPDKPEAGRYASDEVFEMMDELGTNFWSCYMDTRDYFTNLINVYNSELENLMNPVVTTTASNGESRFNDTPQNLPVNNAYAADNYTTNITKSESGSTISSDNMTKMARIDELQKMLRNLFADWAFEFSKMVVGE